MTAWPEQIQRIAGRETAEYHACCQTQRLHIPPRDLAPYLTDEIIAELRSVGWASCLVDPGPHGGGE